MTVIINGTQGTTTPGLYSNAAFTGTFVDGIVADYTTGLGRISVGSSDGLAFYNGGVATTELMRLDASGNLGIGTTSPASRLNVSASNGSVIFDSTAALAANNGTSLNFRAVSDGGGTLANVASVFGAKENATSGNYAGYLSFSTESSAGSLTERARIDSSGNLLVGETSAGYSAANRGLVEVNGASTALYGLRIGSVNKGYLYHSGSDMSLLNDASGKLICTAGIQGVYLSNGATSWTSNSDERLKTELTPFTNPLQKVCSLRSGTGRYLTDDETVSRSFLIAQDVQAVLPEAVDVESDEQGTLGLRYQDIIPLLTAAIQEQQAIIESLKARLDAANL